MKTLFLPFFTLLYSINLQAAIPTDAGRYLPNQKVDLDNEIVLQHTKYYNEYLNSITPYDRLANGVVSLNPFGTAPSSAFIGVYSDAKESIVVTVSSSEHPSAEPISYGYELQKGANLIEVVGLVPDAKNEVALSTSRYNFEYSITTSKLPATDADIPNTGGFEDTTGFPIITQTIKPEDTSKLADGVYFIHAFGRANVALDNNGNIRWYTSRYDDPNVGNIEMPSFSPVRLSNGHFIAASEYLSDLTNLDYMRLVEFDMMGRYHKVIDIENRAHHAIQELPDGRIIYNSEYTSGREGEERKTVEDVIAVIDLDTGKEEAFYDLKNIIDFDRYPVPIEENGAGADGEDVYDWVHSNDMYYDESEDLIVVSGRHQGVFGIDAETSELKFILGSHQGWGEQYQKMLLTPVDDRGEPLYDLSNPEEVDTADKDFWNWGQHNVRSVVNSNKNIVEFTIFNNGAYKTRGTVGGEGTIANYPNAVLPSENWSELVHYKVDLSTMTVQRLNSYGKDEVGTRGYSPIVSTAEILANNNMLVAFGSAHIDDTGVHLTTIPGESDVYDPMDQGASESGNTYELPVQGINLVQEIDPETHSPLVEFEVASGEFKIVDIGRYDLTLFRNYKMDLYPTVQSD